MHVHTGKLLKKQAWCQHDCTGIIDLSPLAGQFGPAVLKSSVYITFINILMIVK